MSMITLTPWAAGLSGLAAGSSAVLVGLLLSRPQPLRWAAGPRGVVGWINRYAAQTRRRLSPAVLAQADVLQLSARQVLALAAGGALVVGLVVAALLPVRWLGVPAAVTGFYLTPSLQVRQRFRAYQEAMRAAFEVQVLLLRIYFDLGFSVLEALRLMRSALYGPARQELDRLLSDLAEGRRDAAFHAWAARTGLLEYRLLADTSVQQRGRALRGDALDPLDTLLAANRQQSMKTLTDRLASSAATTPIVAVMAVVALYLYALFARVPGLHSLNLHL